MAKRFGGHIPVALKHLTMFSLVKAAVCAVLKTLGHVDFFINRSECPERRSAHAFYRHGQME